MHAPRLVSFSLWALTAFILVGTYLKYASPQPTPLPPFSIERSASYDPENFHRLFPITAEPSIKTKTTSSSDLSLKGILFSNDSRQSRALIQSKGAKAKAFAVDQQLPNGAQLLKIDRRSITYELQGQQQQILLPKKP